MEFLYGKGLRKVIFIIPAVMANIHGSSGGADDYEMDIKRAKLINGSYLKKIQI